MTHLRKTLICLNGKSCWVPHRKKKNQNQSPQFKNFAKYKANATLKNPTQVPNSERFTAKDLFKKPTQAPNSKGCKPLAK